MKATREKEAFNPVTLVLESKEELRALMSAIYRHRRAAWCGARAVDSHISTADAICLVRLYEALDNPEDV